MEIKQFVRGHASRILFVHIRFFDNTDRMNVFFLWRTFAAAAAVGKIVFQLFRINFTSQSFDVHPHEQFEKAIKDTVFERIRRSIAVKDTDRENDDTRDNQILHIHEPRKKRAI